MIKYSASVSVRKFSSAGRASALQAEGHRFEPCNFHQNCGPVVQLVRTLACHARGREFEPHPGRQFASVAQLVEQGTENPRVIGSIPIGGTIFCGFSSSGRAPPCQGGGSEFEPRKPLQKTEPTFSSVLIWCRGQVVRQRSAKPSFTGSNPVGTSNYAANVFHVCGVFVVAPRLLCYTESYARNFFERGESINGTSG